MRSLLLLLLVVAAAHSPPAAQQDQHSGNASVTAVFLVPHVHADTGWMIKFEEYYEQVVVHILDSVVASLQVDPARRFCWAEVAYIARWWEDQNATVREAVRELAQGGQLEFVEGGWSQSDEQVADLDERVENLMVGHEWLQRNIGAFAKPRHAWKLDPFGGGTLSPVLFDALRWDSLTKMRVPYALKSAAQSAGAAEMVWRVDAADHAGSSRAAPEIFTHLLTSYSGLENQGFDFDQYREKSPSITAANVAARAKVFAALAIQWAGYYNTSGANMLQLPWGGDMRWQNASYYYGNMTVLIEYVNARPSEYGLHVRWATPSEYFDALHATTQTVSNNPHSFPLLEGDKFTPYDSNMGSAAMKSFWTGIYDSETEEKRDTRLAMSVLRAATTAFALAEALDHLPRVGGNHTVVDDIAELAEAGHAVGIGVHHDAIPGTSNTGEYTGSDPIHGGFVVQDYVARLESGTAAAERSLERSLARVHGLATTGARLQWHGRGELLDGDALPATVLVHNPSQRAVRTVHSLYVRSSTRTKGLIVRDSEGKAVPAQLEEPVTSAAGGSTVEVAFLAAVPPLGSTTFIVSAAAPGEIGAATPVTVRRLLQRGRSSGVESGGDSNLTVVHGGCMSITIDSATGELHSIQAAGTGAASAASAAGAAAAITARFVEYANTTSGSYAFVPAGPATPVLTGPVHASLTLGSVRSSVTREWPASALTQTVQLLAHSTDTLCSAVSVHAGTRRGVANASELVLRLESDLENGNPPVVSTDNGLAMVRWRYNSTCVTSCKHRDLLAGNYRAVLNRAEIGDSTRRLELVVDRAHGVASLTTGHVEVKLQRNVGADGDGPAANDTRPLIAPVHLLLSAQAEDRYANAQAAVRANVSDPLMTFLVLRQQATHRDSSGRGSTAASNLPAAPLSMPSALSPEWVQGLPTGVRIQSLRSRGRESAQSSSQSQSQSEVQVLLRFVNYNRRTVSVDLVGMLAPPLTLSGFVPTTLTGTSTLEDATARRLRWRTIGPAENASEAAVLEAGGGAAVLLAPLSVQTWSAVVRSL